MGGGLGGFGDGGTLADVGGGTGKDGVGVHGAGEVWGEAGGGVLEEVRLVIMAVVVITIVVVVLLRCWRG